MQLSSYERETVINYNEAEPTASIYTHNAAERRHLDKLCEEYPGECRKLRELHDGQAVEYIYPKRWNKIRPPRRSSEAQKEALQRATEKRAMNRRKNAGAFDTKGEWEEETVS